MIETIAREKEAAGVSPPTVNRLLEIIRAILRKALAIEKYTLAYAAHTGARAAVSALRFATSSATL